MVPVPGVVVDPVPVMVPVKPGVVPGDVVLPVPLLPRTEEDCKVNGSRTPPAVPPPVATPGVVPPSTFVVVPVPVKTPVPAPLAAAVVCWESALRRSASGLELLPATVTGVNVPVVAPPVVGAIPVVVPKPVSPVPKPVVVPAVMPASGRRHTVGIS